ncbi:MAG: hypothetical protein Ctma_1517 [Catillopecten margaritatus gill symbiont]|uniref:Uncharacterized protein n=1 Tax=Catillopecten margaritatus gill symbiont TaxID=3083288 RepID=A0AAU6PIE8_9GAMM
MSDELSYNINKEPEVQPRDYCLFFNKSGLNFNAGKLVSLTA